METTCLLSQVTSGLSAIENDSGWLLALAVPPGSTPIAENVRWCFTQLA